MNWTIMNLNDLKNRKIKQLTISFVYLGPKFINNCIYFFHFLTVVKLNSPM